MIYNLSVLRFFKKHKYQLLLVLFIGLTAYFFRWTLKYKFDPQYWENYYYESQWNVPNSTRSIPDEGVYRYIGYRLVNGENPFNVDYWVPPLGKYWYGFSAQFFNNPYITSWIVYLLSIIVFSQISRQLLKSKSAIWLSIFLYSANPVIVNQLTQTMLDLPLTLFFLCHVFFLFKLPNSANKLQNIILSGVFLGLMAGTKPPYFIPLIALVDLYFLYRLQLIRHCAIFCFSVFSGYVLAYTCYFLAHPNPIPWIRLHQKVIEFQKGNGGSHYLLSIFRVIFTGNYLGYWTGAKNIVLQDWSLVLPLGTLLVFSNLTKIRKIVSPFVLYFTLLVVGYILMNLTIDFWPRYLIPLVPLFVLLIVFQFQSHPLTPKLILVSYLPFLFLLFFPTPRQILEDYPKYLGAGLYKESYLLLDSSTRSRVTLSDWQQLSTQKVLSTFIKEDNQWRVRLPN